MTPPILIAALVFPDPGSVPPAGAALRTPIGLDAADTANAFERLLERVRVTRIRGLGSAVEPTLLARRVRGTQDA